MSKIIVGIDPGTTETGVVFIGSDILNILYCQKVLNERLANILSEDKYSNKLIIACETIQSYGMAFGETTIETIKWIGEFRRIAKQQNIPFFEYPRPEWSAHVTGDYKHKSDSDVYQALKLRFGDTTFQRATKGTKSKPGREAGKYASLTTCSDVRSAFGVAFYHLERGK